MSDDGTIGSDDVTDGNDVTGAGFGKRLGKIERILTRANTRLSRINAAMGQPPDDGQPQILASIASIITLANQAIVTANEIKTTVEGDPTGGGTGIPGGGPG